MTDRRYSLTEIDQMRVHLYSIEAANERYPLEGGSWVMSGSWEDREKFKSQRVEDQLRTYMTGGVGVAELLAKAEAARAAQDAWYAEERKRIEDRRLIKEYGPR